MKKSEIKLNRRRILVRRAMQGFADLPDREKIELLHAAADVLPRAEGDPARGAAFALEQAESLQLQFARILDEAGERRPAA